MEQSTRIIRVLRIFQTACCLTSTGCSIACVVYLWDYEASMLTTHAAWASVDTAIIAALLLCFFLRRPTELWPLPLLLDFLGFACGITCVAVLGRAQYVYYEGMIILILPMVAMAIATTLFFAIGVYTWRLQIGPRHSDPLKPYLMKREIDVWCYPVQNEAGQATGVQYIPAATGTQPHDPAPKQPQVQPSEPPSYSQPSIQGDYRIDHIELVPNPQQSVRSQPLTDTVAGWSVPSGSATLRLSQISPGNFSASFKSPEWTIRSRDVESHIGTV